MIQQTAASAPAMITSSGAHPLAVGAGSGLAAATE
jgi:hypothetical protein